MSPIMRRCALFLALGVLLMAAAPARADEIENKVVGVSIGIIAGIAAAVVIIIVVVKHKPSITGCVAEGPGGLTLQNEADNKSYVLHGDTASVKAGERVKVSGKHQKGSGDFDVIKLNKSYGACAAAAHS